MAQVELKVFSALCATEVFTVDGVKADTDDFGSSSDAAPDEAEAYACGNRQFERIPATPEVLAKYGIGVEEYESIAGQLEQGLSFGRCHWCV